MAININNLSKLGIGTWGLGGFQHHDPSIDQKEQAEAVAYTFRKGINYVETTLWYSGGYATKILADAIRKSKISRDQIFISQALYDYDHSSVDSLMAAIERFHEMIGTDYSDAILVNAPAFIRFGFEAVCIALEQQLDEKKARYVSVTNVDAIMLKKLHSRFGSRLFGHELHIDFEVRVLDDLGIIQTGEKLGIKGIVAQPLRRNRTADRNWPLLHDLANKYKATQNQLILAWLISRGLMPLVKSTNIKHIDENIEAVAINLDQEDVEAIDSWRPDIKWLEIDWDITGQGVLIHQLANIFDEEYDMQHEGK